MSQEVTETEKARLMVLLAKVMAGVMVLPMVPRDRMVTTGMGLHLGTVHMVQDQAPTLETTMVMALVLVLVLVLVLALALVLVLVLALALVTTMVALALVAAMVVLVLTSLVAHFQTKPVIQAVPQTRSASLETVSPSQIPYPAGPQLIVSPVSSVVSPKYAPKALPVSTTAVSSSKQLSPAETLSALVDTPASRKLVFFLETLQIAVVKLALATRSAWVISA
jgi:hypothetical protein